MIAWSATDFRRHTAREVSGECWPFKIHWESVFNEDVMILMMRSCVGDRGWKSVFVTGGLKCWVDRTRLNKSLMFFLLMGPNVETLFKGLAHFLHLLDAYYLFILVLWHSMPSGSSNIHRQWVIIIWPFLVYCDAKQSAWSKRGRSGVKAQVLNVVSNKNGRW